MDLYLTGLTATDITLGSIKSNMSEGRAAITAFQYNNRYYNELTGNVMLRPKPQSSLEKNPTISAFIDYRCEVQPRDYGILLPG